ncbi:hypothetical protein VTN49DRAFT_1888 [Thermomyces lanuginosus]|uniref:uncharacterized protein n=1 Tax=Thermomyces lanuginosus TaxID=5541 RepID=UPI003743630F
MFDERVRCGLPFARVSHVPGTPQDGPANHAVDSGRRDAAPCEFCIQSALDSIDAMASGLLSLRLRKIPPTLIAVQVSFILSTLCRDFPPMICCTPLPTRAINMPASRLSLSRSSSPRTTRFSIAFTIHWVNRPSRHG